MTRLELLAPAKSADIGIEALKYGADAVYIGARSHGARHSAQNTTADIARLCDYAHKFYAKVYVTLNTLVYEDELKEIEKLIHELYRAGTDALIIQDLGILKLDIPPIPIHASTQCDIRNVDAAKLYEALGFSRLVLARELSLKDIKEIRKAVDIPLEAFVHGSLCVCYSGCCTAGYRLNGRSGNRGECPQICRLPFSLSDSTGRKIIENRHLLSLKDMNRIGSLEEMADTGISSFKIEGRLKEEAYVKNVVTAYRRELDRIIDKSEGGYGRSSEGKTASDFVPDLSSSFNRGYTEYFLHGKKKGERLASWLTPKMTGPKVATVTNIGRNYLTVNIEPGITFSNGDGLGYFDDNKEFNGFRLNKTEGNILYPLNPGSLRLRKGMALYRNSDKARNDMAATDITHRHIGIDMKLRSDEKGTRVFLELADRYGHNVTVSTETGCLPEAKSPQEEYRRGIFGKLGETVWVLDKYTDEIPGFFIPASTLTTLRREGLGMIEHCRKIGYKRDSRRNMNLLTTSCSTEHWTVRNISNSKGEEIAREFLGENAKFWKALEVSDVAKGLPTMECKYCIRNELGKCMKGQVRESGHEISGQMYIDSGKGLRYRVEFDCKRCRMLLYQENPG